MHGLPGQGKEGIGNQPRAGSVGLPLVLKEARIGVDISIEGRVSGAGGIAAVLRVSPVAGLRPEAVKHEGAVLSAFGSAGVSGAELRGPGEIEEIEIEGTVGGVRGETATALPMSGIEVGGG